MLEELTNFVHTTTSTIWFESHDKIEDVMHANHDFVAFISKYLYLASTIVVNFADRIKVATMLFNKNPYRLKKINWKKKKRLCITMQSTSLFLNITKKADVSRM